MRKDKYNEGITIVSPTEEILYCNRAAERIFGTPHGDLVGRNLSEFLSSAMQALVKIQTNIRKAGKKTSYDLEITGLDGIEREISVSAEPQYDKEGNFVGAIGFFYDLKEQSEILNMDELLYSLLNHNLNNISIVINGYLSHLKNTHLDTEQLKVVDKSLITIDRGISFLKKINSLFSLEKDVHAFRSEDLTQVINGAIKRSLPLAKEKGVIFDYYPLQTRVRGAPILEDVFTLIFEVAIQYMELQTLTIVVYDMQEIIAIDIANKDKTIPKTIKNSLNKLETMKHVMSSNSELSVYFVNRVISSYGGSIRVEQLEQGGEVFRISLEKEK